MITDNGSKSLRCKHGFSGNKKCRVPSAHIAFIYQIADSNPHIGIDTQHNRSRVLPNLFIVIMYIAERDQTEIGSFLWGCFRRTNRFITTTFVPHLIIIFCKRFESSQFDDVHKSLAVHIPTSLGCELLSQIGCFPIINRTRRIRIQRLPKNTHRMGCRGHTVWFFETLIRQFAYRCVFSRNAPARVAQIATVITGSHSRRIFVQLEVSILCIYKQRILRYNILFRCTSIQIHVIGDNVLYNAFISVGRKALGIVSSFRKCRNTIFYRRTACIIQIYATTVIAVIESTMVDQYNRHQD